jgi:transcriptional/translational regulatory protein YebC/TACO1
MSEWRNVELDLLEKVAEFNQVKHKKFEGDELEILAEEIEDSADYLINKLEAFTNMLEDLDEVKNSEFLAIEAAVKSIIGRYESYKVTL